MKLIKLTTVAILTTSALAAAGSTYAEEVRDVTTDGQVVFVPGDDETIVDPTEPDGPEVTIPPVGPEGQTGPLTIAYAPTLDFGTQLISNQDMTYNQVAEMQPLTDGSGEVPYVSFAQVQDKRGSNAGWNLTVALSEFENQLAQNKILTGAEINFSSPRLQFGGNNASNAPETHTGTLNLAAGGAAQSVLVAEAGKGAGTSSVVWGDQASLDSQAADPSVDVIENDSIQLFVPGATAKDAVQYNATLTWELSNTPVAGENTPEV